MLLTFSRLRRRHYSEPNIPSVPGLENFKGESLNIHVIVNAANSLKFKRLP